MNQIIYTMLLSVLLLFTGNKPHDTAPAVIYIQPLGHVDSSYVKHVSSTLSSFYHVSCVILPEAALSNDILADSKTRYEASRILHKYNSVNRHVIVITEKDIASRKSASIPEWGIFGLGYCPGNVCVVSTFRIRKGVSHQRVLDRLAKISIHEVGHNYGLQHCTVDPKCLMNAAHGTISQVDQEQVRLCTTCTNHLLSNH